MIGIIYVYDHWLQQHATGVWEVSWSMLAPGTQSFLFDVKDSHLLSVVYGVSQFRKYVWLCNVYDRIKFVKFVHEELKHECHEVFVEGSKIKFFIDCDNTLTTDQLKGFEMPLEKLIETMAADYVTALKHTLEYVDLEYDNYAEEIDYCYTNRSRTIPGGIKISTHIIVNVVMNVLECKAVVKHMIKESISELGTSDEYNSFLIKCIDVQPYRKNGSLSLPNGMKKGNKNSILKPFLKTTTSTYLLDWNDCALRHDFSDDLVITEQTKSQSFEDSSSEFINEALHSIDKIGDYNSNCMDCYSRPPRGNCLIVDRIAESHCSVCDTIHQSDNTMIIIFNEKLGKAWWKCNHAPEGTKARCWYSNGTSIVEIEEEEIAESEIQQFAKRSAEIIEEGKKKKSKEKEKEHTKELKVEFLIEMAEQLKKFSPDLIRHNNYFIAELLETPYWESPRDLAKA